MRADRLLIAEAQMNYMQRRKQMMKQVIIDNVHYCTMKQILDRAVDPPEEIERKERNQHVKAKARKLIVHDEKAKYKDKYEAVVK